MGKNEENTELLPLGKGWLAFWLITNGERYYTCNKIVSGLSKFIPGLKRDTVKHWIQRLSKEGNLIDSRPKADSKTNEKEYRRKNTGDNFSFWR